MAFANVKSSWKSGDLVFEKYVASANPLVIFGIEDTGLDVKFWGASSGSYMLWDESDDALKLEEAPLLIGARGADGEGVTIVATDGSQQRALLVCVDDGGAALTAGWCQAILGSTLVYTAVVSGSPSIFGTSGELWLQANVATESNLSGLQGAAVVESGKTITGNLFGSSLGCVWPSGAIHGAGYYTGGLIIGGLYDGTMNGKVVGIYFQNPTGSTMFDAAFAFGQNEGYAGMVDISSVGGSNTHRLKVYAGGVLFYIALYSS